jgi:hypothetical protein
MLAFSPTPTTFPWRTGAGGGQGWPKGHREAAPSVLEGHPPPCDAGNRRALDPTSASHDPYEASGSGSGKPIKKRDGDPINYRAPAHSQASIFAQMGLPALVLSSRQHVKCQVCESPVKKGLHRVPHSIMRNHKAATERWR